MALNKENIAKRKEYIKFCIATKQIRKALETISDILKSQPKDFDNLILAGCLLMSEGRSEEAEIYIQNLLNQDEEDIEMNALTSFLYFEIFEDCELLG